MSMIGNTIGEKLKNQRIKLKLTLSIAANETKIREDSLRQLEENDFSKFTSHLYTKGFIRNYAKYLKLDPVPLIAIYKRDYEVQTTTRVNLAKPPKQHQKPHQKEVLLPSITLTSRKLTVAIALIIFATLGVLLLQVVKNAFTAPELRILTPVEAFAGETKKLSYSGSTMIISGETAPFTVIRINEEVVPLKQGFIFESTPYPITSDRSIFLVTATSQLGVQSTIKIELEKENMDINYHQLEALVLVKTTPIYIQIRADNITAYNDFVLPGKELIIEAESSLEIETPDFSELTLTINGQIFQLTKELERFDYVDGIVVQR